MTVKVRRWTKRENELLLARSMYLEEFAEFLERTPCEVWARAEELGVDLALRASVDDEPPPAAEPEPAIDPADQVLGPTTLPLTDLKIERSAEGMEAEAAERIARRMALALYRGSIEVARDALEEAWTAHVGEVLLPQGPELLRLPLSRAIPEVRTLNAIEAEGIETIGDFCERGAFVVQETKIRNVGDKTKGRLLDLIRELRIRSGLEKPSEPAQTLTIAPAPEPGRRGRQKKAVADDSPEMRKFCEEETVRLLPLIEKIAVNLGIPLPLADLIQEGAKGCFEALPRYDPNKHQREGKPLKVETFVGPRIRGAMLDYVRKMGRLTTGGARTGRIEHVHSLTAPLATPFTQTSDRPKTLGDALEDTSLDDPAEVAARRSQWHDVLKGFQQPERILVLEYFVHGRTLRAIGVDLALSESRCSQMLTSILQRLRDTDRVTGGRVREALA